MSGSFLVEKDNNADDYLSMDNPISLSTNTYRARRPFDLGWHHQDHLHLLDETDSMRKGRTRRDSLDLASW